MYEEDGAQVCKECWPHTKEDLIPVYDTFVNNFIPGNSVNASLDHILFCCCFVRVGGGGFY